MKVQSLSSRGAHIGAGQSRKAESGVTGGPGFQSLLESSSEEPPGPVKPREAGKSSRAAAPARDRGHHVDDDMPQPHPHANTPHARPSTKGTRSEEDLEDAESAAEGDDSSEDDAPEAMVFAGVTALPGLTATSRGGASAGAVTPEMTSGTASISFSLLDGRLAGLMPAAETGVTGSSTGLGTSSSDLLDQTAEAPRALTRAMLAALSGEEASRFRRIEPRVSKEQDLSPSADALQVDQDLSELPSVLPELGAKTAGIDPAIMSGRSLQALTPDAVPVPNASRGTEQTALREDSRTNSTELESSSATFAQARDLQADLAVETRTPGVGQSNRGAARRGGGPADTQHAGRRTGSESATDEGLDEGDTVDGQVGPRPDLSARGQGAGEREREDNPGGSSRLPHEAHGARTAHLESPDLHRQFEAHVGAASASEGRPVDTGDWAGRVRLAISGALGSGEGADKKAVVELHDSDLGRMRIEVSMQDGRIKLDMWAEQDDARRMLRDSRHVLQEELARHQMHLDQFEVGGGLDRQAEDSRRQLPGSGGPAGGRSVLRTPASSAQAGRVSLHEGQIDTMA